MQEENPETEMRGRELPGGGTVVAVDSGCVVVQEVFPATERKDQRDVTVFIFFLVYLLFFGSLLFCPSVLWLSVFFLLWPEWLTLACSQVSQDRLRVRFIQFDEETRHQMPWEGGHPTSLAGEEDE
jgi:hypothetical protein